jgi:hypothetical protein
LRGTAGHVVIRGVPHPNKVIAPPHGRSAFVTGGIWPRLVHLDFGFSFYVEDEKNTRGYFGLSPDLEGSWLHTLAAADHGETVEFGVQLHRNFDFVKESYAIKWISFPTERVSFGYDSYPIMKKSKVEELAKRRGLKLTKDRIFRAAVEAGYVF